jgi:hypothetical protein
MPPPGVGTTRALLLMFWALNGATFRPWLAYQRHKAVASQLLPAPLVVPSTMTHLAGCEVDFFCSIEFILKKRESHFLH